MITIQNIRNQIDDSANMTNIVHLERSEMAAGVEDYLRELAEDYVATNDDRSTVEYWGSDEDAGDWRIHVHGASCEGRPRGESDAT